MDDIIDAEGATTWATNPGGHETVTEASGPSWDEIEHFIAPVASPMSSDG